MADIFISYAKEDRSRIIPLVKALEAQGWSVWWDRTILPGIPPGKSFDQVIVEAITAAKCVVVLWSKKSIKSDWVIEEAKLGRERNMLLPVLIDDVQPTLGSGLIETADFIDWKGDSTDPQFQKLISNLSAILGPPPLKIKVPEQTRAEAKTGNIFISYSRKDQSYVRDLAVYLENEGLSVWVDERIEHGDRWWQTIVANIRKCAAMIVVMTPESEKTDWVEREYFYANRIKKPLFPLLLNGDCFPFFVNRQYSDVRDRSMPSKALLESLRQLAEQANDERKRKEEEEQKRAEAVRIAEEERKQKEAEAKRKADDEKRRKEKEELKREAEEERKKKEAEAKRKAEEEPKRREEKTTIKSSEPHKTKNALKLVAVAGVIVLLIAGIWWYISGSQTKKQLITEQTDKSKTPVEKPKISTQESPSSQNVIKNTVGMKFVLIPAGKFIMGSPSDELDRETDEKQHEVIISKPFYLQTTEVSQGQWKRVMGNNPSRFTDCGDDCPVEQVSWNDVQEFISKLNQMEGTNKYRFPTEAEWEYACRAGTTTAFSFGSEEDKLGDYAWYSANSERQTHPVRKKKPNAWDLYDMHGNVWEWCQDWYGDYPSNSVVDPKGPDKGEYRVLRGGSWGFDAWGIRSADRGLNYPDVRYDNFGFRVARAF